jgi:hypothetical protein
MTNATPNRAIRELDRRTNDGVDVRLLWKSAADEVVVAVHDTRTDDMFELEVAPADALFAFHHPFAHGKPLKTGRLLTR